MNFKTYVSLLALTSAFSFAQDLPKEVEAARKQVPTDKEAAAEQAEFHSNSLATDSKTKSDVIAKRIQELQKRQAAYLKDIASGKVKPNAELTDKWPKIQEDLLSLRGQISDLNKLNNDDPRRPQLEVHVLSALQELGSYLILASHPKFESRKFDSFQIAEMTRIQKAITTMEFGDRSKAKPVRMIEPAFHYTLIHLPTPITLKSEPNETIYLSADTGGVFSNELPYIELKTDDKGIARTTWMSIGEAVATCYITIYSKVAIESQQFSLEVVSPFLVPLDGLPAPDKKLLPDSDSLKPSQLKENIPTK